MTSKRALKIIKLIENLFDTLPDEQLSPWNFFVEVNNIVSQQDGIDCLININFANGGVTQGICVLTDWEPGAVVLQSDDGSMPKLRVVFPEEYVSFMEYMRPIFEAQYPEFPKEQE